MTAPSLRSIPRALALLALIACQAAGPDSARSPGPVRGGEEVATTTVGMWGNDDGWSLVEPLRLGVIERDAPAHTGGQRCPRAEIPARVQPLHAHLEKVSAAPGDDGALRG